MLQFSSSKSFFSFFFSTSPPLPKRTLWKLDANLFFNVQNLANNSIHNFKKSSLEMPIGHLSHKSKSFVWLFFSNNPFYVSKHDNSISRANYRLRANLSSLRKLPKKPVQTFSFSRTLSLFFAEFVYRHFSLAAPMQALSIWISCWLNFMLNAILASFLWNFLDSFLARKVAEGHIARCRKLSTFITMWNAQYLSYSVSTPLLFWCLQ